MALLALAACAALSACSGDEAGTSYSTATNGKVSTPATSENSSGGTAKAENTCITTVDGDALHITGNGAETYSFGEDGLPTGYLDSWEDNYYISYSPMRIRDDYGDVYNVTLNEAGFISNWTSSYTEEGWDGDELTGTEEATIAYDNEGHIISCTGLLTEEGDTDGSAGEKAIYHITMNYKWENGNLTGIDSKWEYTENGETIRGYDTMTFLYENPQYRNTTGQFSHGLSMMISDFPEIAFMGFYGKPSACFPTKVIDKYQDLDDYGTPDFDKLKTYSYTYSFNPDGTIDWEEGGRVGVQNPNKTFHYQYSKAPVVSGIQPIMRAQPKHRRQGHRHSRLRHFRH